MAHAPLIKHEQRECEPIRKQEQFLIFYVLLDDSLAPMLQFQLPGWESYRGRKTIFDMPNGPLDLENPFSRHQHPLTEHVVSNMQKFEHVV